LEKDSVRLKWCYVLAGAYLLLGILYIGMVSLQIGHGSNPFDFIFYLNWPACYVLDLFPDLIRTKSALPQILTCLIAGLVMYALIGYLIDVVVSRFRKR
jgi:hypothetical protein